MAFTLILTLSLWAAREGAARLLARTGSYLVVGYVQAVVLLVGFLLLAVLGSADKRAISGLGHASGMRTARQRRGIQAEDDAAAYLEQAGWQLIGRNIRVGRDEIDILATDPGPPRALVFVEVRGASSPAFGMPEERVDRAKVGHLYRAARSLPFPRQLPRRVDLVIVDRRRGRPVIRHMRMLEPPT